MKNQKLINQLSPSTWGAFSAVAKDNKFTPQDMEALMSSLRMFDSHVERIGKLKIPVSKTLFEKYSIKFYSTEHKNIKTHREHIITIEERTKQALSHIIYNGYGKDELYEWLIETMYLVYKSKEEHNEKLNGGKLAEENCLPSEFINKQKWDIFSNGI